MSQYAKRLDRSRDYGQSCPPENGVTFIQDGYPFDHEGKIVDRALSDEQKKALAPKKPAAGSAAGASPPRPPKPPKQQPAAAEPAAVPQAADADDLNLELWLRGEATYKDGDVRKAVKERYSRWCTKIVDVLDELVGVQKLVAKSELAPRFKKLLGE